MGRKHEEMVKQESGRRDFSVVTVTILLSARNILKLVILISLSFEILSSINSIRKPSLKKNLSHVLLYGESLNHSLVTVQLLKILHFWLIKIVYNNLGCSELMVSGYIVRES